MEKFKGVPFHSPAERTEQSGVYLKEIEFDFIVNAIFLYLLLVFEDVDILKDTTITTKAVSYYCNFTQIFHIFHIVDFSKLCMLII